MKLNDLVQIRVGRSRVPAFGLLVSIDAKAGTGVVARNGERYARSLKRIYGKKAKLPCATLRRLASRKDKRS